MILVITAIQKSSFEPFLVYSSICITSTGKRFFIQNGIVWNILDEQEQQCAEAALFFKWNFV
ncbi:MAG: MEKHLA domain-containing protein [Richelia sp.]|nr:MEKHLA domain-containing protein [Richelia sp.]